MENFPQAPNHTEEMRSDEQLNALINAAVLEVVELFGSEMTPRDREMLASVAEEKGTTFKGRILYLLQLPRAANVSEKMPEYVNQVFQTLRQQLTEKEKEMLQTWKPGASLIDDIK